MEFDYLLVGGGLQNGLIALCLYASRRDVRVGMIERGGRLGGNHTWCFHEADVDPALLPLIAPMVGRRWPGYDVAFPNVRRALAHPYCTVSSDSFDKYVSAYLQRYGCALLQNTEVKTVSANEVELADGRRISAALVVDGRGPSSMLGEPLGYQKFLGLELVLRRATSEDRPLLMDATVPQRDGFRFMYRLPLSPHRILIEDTYYSDDPRLDEARLRTEVLAYAKEGGWTVAEIARQETGVLPLFGRSSARFAEPGPLVVGYRGGFFHPTTGYSFCIAARLAQWLAGTPQVEVASAWPMYVAEHARRSRFFGWLNRMLFGAFAPEDRRNVLERFYRLPDEVVFDFYALRLSARDKGRIVCGRPPRGFSIRRALHRGEGTCHGAHRTADST